MSNIFTLSPNELCNYRCFYCFNGPAPNLTNKPLASPHEIVQCINSLAPRVFVNLSGGGEPMLYPDIKLISRMLVKEGHWLGISTNFAVHRWQDYLKGIPPEQIVLISASYHNPTEVNSRLKKQFFNKARWVRDQGYNITIKYIMHPERLKGQFQKAQEEFGKIGMRVLPMPFRGVYEGRQYPADFTKEEIELILDGMERPFIFDPITSFKGRICDSGCRMGWIYAHRSPEVVRCWFGEPMGTIQDGVQWHKTPQVCTTDVCPSRIYMREIGMVQGEPDLRYYFWRDRHLNAPKVLNWLDRKHGIKA